MRVEKVAQVSVSLFLMLSTPFFFPLAMGADETTEEKSLKDTSQGIILKFEDAKVFDSKKTPVKPSITADGFSKGMDLLSTVPEFQIEWPLPDTFPEGKYHIALPLRCGYFFEFNEFEKGKKRLHKNDQFIPWTSHSIPERNPNPSPKKAYYNGFLRVDEPIELKAGDILRVDSRRGAPMGPIRLSVVPFDEKSIEMKSDNIIFHQGRRPTPPLLISWTEAAKDANETRQGFELLNFGSLPKTITLHYFAKDYFQKELFDKSENLTIQPGEKVNREAVFPSTGTGRIIFAVEVSAVDYSKLSDARYYFFDIDEGERTKKSLDGNWEYCFAKGAELGDSPPADAEWKEIVVPAYLPMDGGHCAWLRKSFEFPSFTEGKRAIIVFDSVVYEATIYLNGKKTHYQKCGTEPFEADVTDAFIPGKENTLLIGLRDWLAYSPKNRERLEKGESLMRRKDVTWPVGHTSGWHGFGIHGKVSIEARPSVHVADVFVVTSVREKKLTLRYKILNSTKEKQKAVLAPKVLLRGELCFEIEPKEIELNPGELLEVLLEKDWSDPVLWEPGRPCLYVLETCLNHAEKTLDRHFQRFGFREMWIDGIHFVVNGKRMKIRSQWTLRFYDANKRNNQPEMYAEAWKNFNLHIEANGVQLIRTHNRIGVKAICEIADETGMMLKIENGNVAQFEFTYEREFWDNLLKSQISMIDAYKNHASVFMWSAGNEVVWCFGHQGEKVREFAFDEMAQIAQSMEDFDLMRRPIEWEADSDLGGRWKYHSLHYSKELRMMKNGVPNDAWWDSSAPYSYFAAPVTMGAKPLTTGETFCPYGQPYAWTSIVGDDVYVGGYFWRKGWMEGAQFIINGFRDAEFGLIDTYTPLNMIKEKTIVFKEEVKSYYGGRKLKRHFNVHNDSREDANFDFKWSIVSNETGKVSGGGAKSIELGPAGLERFEIEMVLPNVEKPEKFTFSTDLIEDGDIVHSEQRVWTLYPPLKITLPENSGILLYDSKGDTEKAMKELGVSFKLVKDFSNLEGRSLVIGTNSLPEALADSQIGDLHDFARNGGKVLILQQDKMPEHLLPLETSQFEGTHSTITFAKAPEHPALAELSEEGLKWWADDHFVSRNNFRKIFSGNWLPILDAGTGDGCIASPILEQFYGKGSFIASQLLLTQKISTAPEAGIIFGNLLGHLVAPEPFRTFGVFALLGGNDSALRNVLDSNNVEFECLGSDYGRLLYPNFAVAGIDLAAMPEPESAVEPIRKFAESGGKVLLYRLTPEGLPFVEKLAGAKLSLHDVKIEGTDARNHFVRIGNDGIMAGISNHDLFWASGGYLNQLNGNGVWWSLAKDMPEEEFIVDYYLDAEKSRDSVALPLTMPCAIMEIPCGKGSFIVKQTKLDSPISEAKILAKRLASIFFTNIGATIRGSGQQELLRKKTLSECTFTPIDLAPFANRGIMDDPENDIVGWTNQGINDMRSLPTGKHTFADVPFFISTPRSAIALHSKSGNNSMLPKEVNIPVGKKADFLFFLHGLAFASFPQPFKYNVNYEDGSSKEIPIRNGEHIVDWWLDPMKYKESMALNNTLLAWKGENPANSSTGRDGVSIYCHQWENPEPGKIIASVDFMTVPASGFGSVPVLAGLTLGEHSGKMSILESGIVSELIGTSGVRVKDGDSTCDIHYIGSKGLPQDHPFYDEALKQHGEIALGKKVKIVFGQIKKDADGNFIAYVYPDDEQISAGNSFNAKIIGQGLSEKGNFHGNNEFQLDFDNLEFIAKSNMTGLWKFEK